MAQLYSDADAQANTMCPYYMSRSRTNAASLTEEVKQCRAQDNRGQSAHMYSHADTLHRHMLIQLILILLIFHLTTQISIDVFDPNDVLY